jgi:HSP20 family molecular chaperone IbpA
MAEKEIAVRKETTPASREETRQPESFSRPAVDIFESEESLTLMADLPGVDKEHLDVNLERGVLTIRGTMGAGRSGESILREYSPANYYRQFQLPDEFDTEKTSAEFKNGVLTLILPKSEAARPKRIEIRH